MSPALLDSLASFPDRLESCFRLVPVHLQNWRPVSWSGIPSERLTAIEQLCHVRDIETDGYHLRLQRTLSEPNPSLPDLDGETLARERHYAGENARDVLTAFRAARAATLVMVGGLTAVQLSRPAVFEGRPTVLRGLLHVLASHDEQHLAGLHWLLARMAGELPSE